jgi:DNA-directed RNA polymerase sigma subunit (sigma70/sigma32)
MSLPSSAFNDTTAAAWAGVKLRRRLGRFASLDEIAAETGMSIARTETALATRRMETMVVSVDTPLFGEESLTLGETLAADATERPDAIVEEASTIVAARADFEAVLVTFVPRHQEAMRLRFLTDSPSRRPASRWVSVVSGSAKSR